MKQWSVLGAVVVIFPVTCFLPLFTPRVAGAILQAFKLLRRHARNHAPACVVPVLLTASPIICPARPFLSAAGYLALRRPVISSSPTSNKSVSGLDRREIHGIITIEP